MKSVMKKIFCENVELWAVCFFTIIILSSVCPDLKAEPIDDWVVSEIEYFAVKAFGEEGYKERFDRFYAKRPSRLEWARYFNEVAWRIESKGIYLTSAEEERFDKIVKYFDREYLLIKTASYLEQVPRISLGAEFSVNGEYGWGEDVATSVLSLYQQLRVVLEARRKNLTGRLSLRNFGFWGVNDYSSGSVGIDFKTSDPPSVEELWVEGGEDIRITVGRRYFKYGLWGLAVNRVYQPIDMVEISYGNATRPSSSNKNIKGKSFFEFSAGACSKYENADYFISEIKYEGEDFGAGVAGAISSVSEKVKSDAGVDENEQAASLWSRARFLEGFEMSAEAGAYRRTPDESEVYPFIVQSDVAPSGDVEFCLRYGRIPDMRFPSYSSSRAPLDYISKEYIGTRFSPKTEGYNGIITLKYADPFIIELEYTSLSGIGEDVRYNKGGVRGILAGRSGGIFDRIVFDVSSSSVQTTESDYAEYRFITQLAFRF